MEERRGQDRRVQDRRIQDSRKKKSLMLSIALVSAGLGAIGGFALTLVLDPYGVKLKESPFSPDTGKRLEKGRDFSGVKEAHDLPGAEEDRFRRSLELADSGDAPHALAELAEIRKQRSGFCLGEGTAALLGAGVPAGMGKAGGPTAQPAADSGKDAQRAVQACLAQDSTHPWLHYAAGRWFEAAGLPDSAEAHYLRSIKASPQFAYPYVALGRIRLEEGDARGANRNFRTAIGLMETDSAAYRPGKRLSIPVTETVPYDLLADLFCRVGAEDSARMAMEYGEERGVKTDRMAFVQARLWESRGFLGKADSAYRALQAKDPGNREYADAIATLGWKPQSRIAGDTSRGSRPADAEAIFAISVLDPLARQNPHNGPLWMALGQAYFRRGLYGMATESFDSSLKYDANLPGLSEKRDAAYNALIHQTVPAKPERVSRGPAPLSEEEQTPVVIPGSIALLGTYSVPWGSSQTAVRQAYPQKTFITLPNGNLLDVFVSEGVRHEYLLAFKQGKLWGVRVNVTDTAGVSGDLFGRLIRTKTKISGEGRGTGEAKCEGYKTLQGVIWENDDTFEFMAQFENETNRVRLARIGRDYLPANRRLCDLVSYLREDTWK
jgi:tetratricopeptide (TPR) repeat protein